MTQDIPYQNLMPETILASVDQCGFLTSGHILALNSYENRVYQVGLEDGTFVIVKFYRPQRWSDDAIIEEHKFSQELADLEIPVIAPLCDDNGQTLYVHEGYRYAIYPRCGGHWPELDNEDNLRQLSRLIGRIHAVGAVRTFEYRPQLTVERFGHEPLQFMVDNKLIPAEVEYNYRHAAESVLEQVEQCFAQVGNIRRLRLHGDCHLGNILWAEKRPHFVDLDDCLMGPAIQDLWMLLSGSRAENQRQLVVILEGYNQFFDLDPSELQLIEALRSLRMLHYAGWLGRRWHDPAFPKHFPWFATPHYWEEQFVTLREQIERMMEPIVID